MFIKYKNDMPSKRNNLKVDKLSAFDDSENICYNFDSQIYNALTQYGEKMRYICTYNLITDDDIEKINRTIKNDIYNGLTEDPKNALFAMIILLKYDVYVPLDEIISKKIIQLLQFDELIEYCDYLICNILSKNPENFKQIKQLIIENTIDQLYKANSKIISFWIKLINFYNFEIPLDLFNSFFYNFTTFDFNQKKSFIDLSCSLLMKNRNAIAIFIEYGDSIENFLLENIDICPDQIIFLISTLEPSINFTDEFLLEINEKINSLIEMI